MRTVSKLIPSNRLKWLPVETRLAHEYCFLLHDECARMLVEYESAGAHNLKIQFKDEAEGNRFSMIAKIEGPIAALRALERSVEARRVVFNTITMAMVSDFAHHLYESLRCFEKRKIVPAFNLLRKPLLDSLMYFSWMVADEDDFYTAFSSGEPANITQKIIGNRRKEIIAKALSVAELSEVVQPDDIVSIVFDSRNGNGLYGLFQHAVHLVTVDRIELKTSSENFNFIFKDSFEDDVYYTLYATLPIVMLYIVHLIRVLFERIAPMDVEAKQELIFRSIYGYRFLQSDENAALLAEAIGGCLVGLAICNLCGSGLKVTIHNASRLLFTNTYRCTRCKTISSFPFSQIFRELEAACK